MQTPGVTFVDLWTKVD